MIVVLFSQQPIFWVNSTGYSGEFPADFVNILISQKSHFEHFIRETDYFFAFCASCTLKLWKALRIAQFK